MIKKLKKIIVLYIVFNLFFTGVIIAIPDVRAQTDPAPTSAPAPTKSPSDPKPPSDPAPTTALQPTNAIRPTSAPQPTNEPKPTTIVLPTADIQPTVGPGDNISASPTSTISPSVPSPSSSSQTNSANQTEESESINDPANIASGPFSTNSATEKNTNWQEVVNKNLAELQNKIDVISQTGFNYANLNTLSGHVFTADALSSLNLLNKLNSNMTGIGTFSVFNIFDTYLGDIIFDFADNSTTDSFSSASATVVKNSLTGSGSSNDALAENTFTVKEANGNDAVLNNDIVLEAQTGGNSASYNTAGGYIKTGKASVLANIVNLVNTNLNVSQWLFGVVNVFGTLAGNIILPQDASSNTSQPSSSSIVAENELSGPLSANDTLYENNSSITYSNANSAEINTNISAQANTGGNEATFNTGGGSVSTGNSAVSVSNNTVANTNITKEDDTVWLVIVNQMGKWVGQIIGLPWGATTASNSLPISNSNSDAGQQTLSLIDNSATGPLSTNDSSFTNSQDTEITNQNQASINNNIIANADTGNNKSQYNTGAGIIETGDADIGVNLMNMVNTNVTAKKFAVVFVNILGELLGNIIPTGQIADQSNGDNQIADDDLSKLADQSVDDSSPSSTAEEPTVVTESSEVRTGGSFLSANSSNNNTDIIYDGYEGSYIYYDYINFGLGTGKDSIASGPINTVNERKKVSTRNLLSETIALANYLYNPDQKIGQGIFMSSAFAKASETSVAGLLLGGARLKINETWLSILPLALVLLILRRRRKIDFAKYLNSLLEIIL